MAITNILKYHAGIGECLLWIKIIENEFMNAINI